MGAFAIDAQLRSGLRATHPSTGIDLTRRANACRLLSVSVGSRKNPVRMTGFVCSRCGEAHPGTPTFGFAFPIDYLDVPEAERKERVFLTEDTCVIDDERFFVRGCLEIPVHGGCDPFIWGVWVAVSEQAFFEFQDLLGADTRAHHGPFEGQLSSPPRPYPDSTNLKAIVRLRDHAIRPLVEVEACGHPLALEQRNGISRERVAEIVELMRPRAKSAGARGDDADDA